MAEEQYNQANQEPYAAKPEKRPCVYCIAGKCAERKAQGLCHCGPSRIEKHFLTLPKENQDPVVRGAN